MRQHRATFWATALAAVVVGSTVTLTAPVAAAPAPVAVAAAPVAAVPTANLCGATGTDMNGTGCRYATVGTDTFKAPYYQPNVTFTVYGAKSKPSVVERNSWGGMSKGTLKPTPGATYQINVGGPARGETSQLGGFNGGGDSGRTNIAAGSTLTPPPYGGGGASDVREGSYGLTDRLFVAGGGGGTGGRSLVGGAGGGDNGLDGADQIPGTGGGGGSQTQAGRSPGNAGSAGFGFGGSGGSGALAVAPPGAGGGGGYYGGGGTGTTFSGIPPAAGGGGSGYITPRATDTSSRTGGQVDAYPAPVDLDDLGGEKDGRGLVTATWPGGPTTANVTVTASPSGKVDPDTIVTLTTKVTTSTGVAPVGQIRFVDYTKANGSTSPTAPDACPCSNITGDFVTSSQDGTYVKRVRAGSLPYGSDHAIVAIFDDLYGEIPLTRSAPATYSVNVPPPPGVDLGLSLTATPEPVKVGSELTYTFGVTNFSSTTATAVMPSLFVRNVTGGEVVLDASKTSSFCRVLLPGEASVECDFGEVAAGATETATVVVRPLRIRPQVASGSLFKGPQPDPNPDNDFIEISTVVESADPPPPPDPSADLSVSVQAPTRVDDGDGFLYKIGSYNAGPDTATGVTITDVLPDGVTFDPDTTSPECTEDAGTVTCDAGDYEPGRIKNVTIGVTADQVGSVSNTATIQGDLDDPSSANNSSTATTVVRTPPPPADLSIVKTAPSRVVYRADLVYKIAVTNNGADAAAEVKATDVLPEGTRFKSAGTSSACQPDFLQQVVTCDFGTVAAGATETAEIVVVSDVVRRVSNTATVAGDTADPDPTNNSSTASTLVQDPFSPADLSIRKSAGVLQAEVGDDLTYELEVRNNNTDNTSAFRVAAIDELPDGVTFKSEGTSDACTDASGTVTCDLGQIFGGTSKTVEIVVTATRSGTVSNTATVEGLGVDPDPTNDAATAVVQVTAPPEPGALGFATSDVEVDEGGTASVTVERTGGTDGEVSVDYATSNGTAGSSDYTSATGTLTFADGDTSKTFTVETTQDAAVESDETVELTLSDPTGGATLGDDGATLTITDDDEEPVEPGTVGFAVTNTDVDEGGTATVTVERTDGTDGEVSVDYATSNGTAGSSDYTSATGTLTFADGDTSKTFTVQTSQDSSVEADETVDLTLSKPTGGATLGDASATVTIVDDDEEPEPPVEPGSVGFLVTKTDVDEGGTATVTVERAGGTDGDVAVDYATSNGTADSDDYTSASDTLSFADGETSKTFEVDTTQDTRVEADETVDLSLSNPTGGATIGDGDATLTIIDDDEEPEPPAEPGTLGFSAQDYPVQEGDAATITVTRTGGSDGSVSLTYATSDPTTRAAAAAGSDDYTPTSGTLTFADGVTSRTFTVQTTDDDVDEPDETVTLSLSDATGDAAIGDASATVTIVDNDEAGTDPGDGDGGEGTDPGEGDGGDSSGGGSGGAAGGDGGSVDGAGSSGLPDTGGPDVQLLGLGALLLLTGGTLLVRRRPQDA